MLPNPKSFPRAFASPNVQKNFGFKFFSGFKNFFPGGQQVLGFKNFARIRGISKAQTSICPKNFWCFLTFFFGKKPPFPKILNIGLWQCCPESQIFSPSQCIICQKQFRVFLILFPPKKSHRGPIYPIWGKLTMFPWITMFFSRPMHPNFPKMFFFNFFLSKIAWGQYIIWQNYNSCPNQKCFSWTPNAPNMWKIILGGTFIRHKHRFGLKYECWIFKKFPQSEIFFPQPKPPKCPNCLGLFFFSGPAPKGGSNKNLAYGCENHDFAQTESSKCKKNVFFLNFLFPKNSGAQISPNWH